ncbi:unnamed protein product [Rhodiola kirilowii]
MEEEMIALQKNETWELVPLPEGKKRISCRWVFTIKQNPDGSIDRLKGRLVARGLLRLTTLITLRLLRAPVAKLSIVQVLLSLATNLDWHLQQYDVKNVFLH